MFSYFFFSIATYSVFHMFMPTSEAAFGKGGIVHLHFRKNRPAHCCPYFGANVPPFLSKKRQQIVGKCGLFSGYKVNILKLKFSCLTAQIRN